MFTSSGISENIEGTLEKPETDGLSFFLSLKGIPKNKITIGDALKKSYLDYRVFQNKFEYPTPLIRSNVSYY